MAVTYTIQSGDTLGKIAARFNTTVERLVELNKLSNPNMINVGQVLVIEPQSPESTQAHAAGDAPVSAPAPGPDAAETLATYGCKSGVNLLRNPGFEDWNSPTSPRSWSASNVVRTTIKYSGSYAAEMGWNPDQPAELYQEVIITPRRIYQVTFWVREIGGKNTGRFNLRTTVVYFDRNGEVIGQSDPDYNEDFIPNNQFSQFSFTTGRVPDDALTAQLRFRFRPRSYNENSVAVEYVFMECIL